MTKESVLMITIKFVLTHRDRREEREKLKLYLWAFHLNLKHIEGMIIS